jgi:hypothetical protein
MLAWVMNMGFAASSSGAPVVSNPKEQYLGFSMLKLGGTLMTIALVIMI